MRITGGHKVTIAWRIHVACVLLNEVILACLPHLVLKQCVGKSIYPTLITLVALLAPNML